ncbi:MAG: glutathione S-transferase family protein [Bauldia sp.]|nr:glutathione S-transferase family protein [Bauldia sp.]
MGKPTLYGPDYSTYVRTVRMALAEKQVDYTLVPVDIMTGEGQSAAHLARHPFGKVPAFEHDGFMVYETGAIARYVDEAFPGRTLVPGDLRARARMNQIIGVIDGYAYDAFVWKVFIERNAEGFLRRPTDEAAIAAAMPRVRTCVDALEALAADGAFLCGDSLSLADCWLVPVMGYFTATADGSALLAKTRRLSRWWSSIASHPSVAGTAPAG